MFICSLFGYKSDLKFKKKKEKKKKKNKTEFVDDNVTMEFASTCITLQHTVDPWKLSFNNTYRAFFSL